MMSILRSIGFIYTGGFPISVFSPKFTVVGTGFVGPIPIPVIIMAVAIFLAHILLSRTTFGRRVFALGGNEMAARLSGVNVNWIKTACYVISGLLTSVSGLILAGRLASGQPVAGQGFELDVIAAVVVGGTSLMGGKGGVFGTFLGAVLMGILANGLNLLNVNPYYQMFLKGVVILFAVYLDVHSRAREEA